MWTKVGEQSEVSLKHDRAELLARVFLLEIEVGHLGGLVDFDHLAHDHGVGADELSGLRRRDGFDRLPQLSEQRHRRQERGADREDAGLNHARSEPRIRRKSNRLVLG